MFQRRFALRLFSSLLVLAPMLAAKDATPGVRRLPSGLGNLASGFEPNRGQTGAKVQFLARGEGYVLFLTPGETVLKLRTPDMHAQRVVRLRWAGANRASIRFRVDGAERVRVEKAGDLILEVGGDLLRQRKPLVFQEGRALKGRYVLLGKRLVGFEVPGRDPARSMVIDPVILYSTYLGGGSTDTGNGMMALRITV